MEAEFGVAGRYAKAVLFEVSGETLQVGVHPLTISMPLVGAGYDNL